MLMTVYKSNLAPNTVSSCIEGIRKTQIRGINCQRRGALQGYGSRWARAKTKAGATLQVARVDADGNLEGLSKQWSKRLDET
jgi:hypothetical protein